MSTMRESSKNNWTSNGTMEHINAGSLQRIADAVEVMTRSYGSVIEERDRYLRWYTDQGFAIARLERRNSALRGVIKRMKHERLKQEAKP